MKERLLQWIVCPACKKDLVLKVTAKQGEEITEGTLSCSNNHTYPITGGIPRFVDSNAYAESFAFQWNKFSKVQLDIFNHTTESEETFFEKTGFERSSMSAKLFLDAGTGAGRFAEVVSRLGGEVIGIDLSQAVDAAYRNIGERPNAHFIHADIFQLPFRQETFDYAFSIGVLHHTPDTRKAFEALVPLVKHGGQIAIWVYDKYTEFRRITDTFRKATTRLPKRPMFYASTVAIPLYYLKPFRTIFQGVFRMCMHPNWRWRWLDTFDYYTPKYQWKHTYPEVFSWFQEANLKEITPLSAPVSMRGKKG